MQATLGPNGLPHGTCLDDIDTPALVLDRSRMERNIAGMRGRIEALGVSLRAHVKTNKSVEVARRLCAGGVGPITVSTLREADYFAAHGFTDILYAVGIVAAKLEHVHRLRRQGVELTVVLDSLEAADALCASARALATVFDVMIEIDCDGHRSGVQPGSPVLLEIAAALRAGGQRLAGVMTHAGNAYNCVSVAQIKAMAAQERDAVVGCARRLRAAGHECAAVSVGSTPTATFVDHLEGVTEVRAGVFVFEDLVMAGLGVCAIDDIALSVLATVIGHQREKGWIITDAGWMAMSRDRGTARQRVDQHYGLVCDVQGRPIEGLLLADANQEHGIVAHRSGDPAQVPALPIGTRLRILPNHACATGAQHSRYIVVDGKVDVVIDTPTSRRAAVASPAIGAVWERFNGW